MAFFLSLYLPHPLSLSLSLAISRQTCVYVFYLSVSATYIFVGEIFLLCTSSGFNAQKDADFIDSS